AGDERRYELGRRLAGGSVVLEDALSAVGRQEAAHQVDEGRLARTVGPDQRENFALAHGEVDCIHCAVIAERLGQRLRREKAHFSAPSSSWMRFARSPP